MKILRPGFAALLACTLLPACGGGSGSADPGAPGPAPAPAPAKISLSTTNYQNALTLAMATSSTAYSWAKFGITIVDRMIDVPIFLPPLLSCPAGGVMSVELTDKNGDRSLDPGDTIHYRWDHCRAQDSSTTGVLRVELTEATQTADGREYWLTVTLNDLQLEHADASLPAIPAVTINFIAQVHYVRDANTDRVSVANAVFNSGQVAGDTGTSTQDVEYRQDRATQTYQYSVRGKASSGALGGELEFTTPLPFSGVIGEYPSSGHVLISGANSSARLAEEGTAAADLATVLLAVDSDGDGAADDSMPQVAWASILPVQMFADFSQPSANTVPLP
jgi:hypothetical protein